MLHMQVRRVLDQIRGRSYEEALVLLEYMPFRACEPVLDTLISVRRQPCAPLRCWVKVSRVPHRSQLRSFAACCLLASTHVFHAAC